MGIDEGPADGLPISVTKEVGSDVMVGTVVGEGLKVFLGDEVVTLAGDKEQDGVDVGTPVGSSSESLPFPLLDELDDLDELDEEEELDPLPL